jgi:hypothetical protein
MLARMAMVARTSSARHLVTSRRIHTYSGISMRSPSRSQKWGAVRGSEQSSTQL